MSIKIIADSACDMVGNESEHLKIIPLPVAFGTTQYEIVWEKIKGKLPIGTIGGPIGTHTGPRAFGVAFFAP